MRYSLSKPAALKMIDKSKEASHILVANMEILDKRVNLQFIGLKDPAFISYLELSMQMQEIIKQISGKMEAISDYCQKIINWIDNYGNM